MRHDAKDGRVIGLGSAAGEHNFRGTRADQRGNAFARAFDGLPASLAKAVCGARIAEFGREIGNHGLEHRGVHGRRGVMVEVDALHCRFFRREGGLFQPRNLK